MANTEEVSDGPLILPSTPGDAPITGLEDIDLDGPVDFGTDDAPAPADDTFQGRPRFQELTKVVPSKQCTYSDETARYWGFDNKAVFVDTIQKAGIQDDVDVFTEVRRKLDRLYMSEEDTASRPQSSVVEARLTEPRKLQNPILELLLYAEST